MKRKFVCKRICVVLAGAVLLCSLCACTSSHEKEDYESGNYGMRYGEAIKDETVNAGMGKDESVKGETMKDEVVKDENGKDGAVKRETGKDETVKGESGKDVSVKGETGQDETAKGEIGKDASGKDEAVKGETVKGETGKDASGKDGTEGNGTEDSMLSIGKSYRAILSGEEDFISVDLGNKELNIKDIRNVVTPDDSVTVEPTKFTFLDLDGDGENEIVLWLQINNISDYGFEILHAQEGAVYGYTLPYRAFMDLKTDGTFSFSSGAADSGIGKLRFAEDGYTIEEQGYGEDQQDSKTDVIWYDSF